MATLIIKSNASQLTAVTIDDWGVSIPALGGQEPFPTFDDQKSAIGSRDLLTLLTDDAIAVGSSTLILNDGVSDIAQADAADFLGSLLQSSGSANYGTVKNDAAGEIRQDLTTNAVTPSQLNNWQLGTDLDANNNTITNLPAPVASGDAANKSYVDAVAQGLNVKDSTRVGTVGILDANTDISGTPVYNNVGGSSTRGQITGTLAVSGTLNIDGIAMADGDRLLIKHEGDVGGLGGDVNGIWTVGITGTALVLDRATDFDTDAEVTAAAFTFIEEGTVNADTGWVLTTDNPITIGGASGTPLAWSQFSGAGAINAGNGLTRTGATIDVGAGSVGLIITANALAIDYGEVIDIAGLGSAAAAGILNESARADHAHTHGDRGADSAGSQHDADQVDVEATLTTIGAPDTAETVFANIEALFNGGQKVGKTLQFGQDTDVPSGTGELALVGGGGVSSSAVGSRMLRAGTLTGASIQVDQQDTVRAFKLSIRINGVEVASVALPTSTSGNHDATLSAAYVAGDVLSLYVVRTSGTAAKSTFDDISALVEYTE